MSAVCESYYCCYIEFIGDPEFVASGGSEAVVMGGHYVDTLSRVDGTWKHRERGYGRRLDAEPRGARVLVAPAAAQFTRGRGDDLDPAQVAFAEIRERQQQDTRV